VGGHHAGFDQPRIADMGTIGWAIVVGLLIVVLPLLPVLVIVWALTKLFDHAADRAARWEIVVQRPTSGKESTSSASLACS
jgi:hypothetical protein